MPRIDLLFLVPFPAAYRTSTVTSYFEVFLLGSIQSGNSRLIFRFFVGKAENCRNVENTRSEVRRLGFQPIGLTSGGGIICAPPIACSLHFYSFRLFPQKAKNKATVAALYRA